MVFEQAPRRRNPLPLIIAVIVGVIIIIATYIVLKPDAEGGGGGQKTKNAQRGDCLSLVMSASSEKAALLTELATRYGNAGRTFAGKKCADVKVYAKASGGSAEALGRGWNEVTDGAPAPDVWSPASSSWVRLLQQELTKKDRPALVPTGKISSIAQTPLVLAMPRPMAEALGWPEKAIGWGDVLGLTTNPKGWGAVGHPEWGEFRLGKTNPNFSTSGLNATIGTYFAATGRSSDLSPQDVADPKVTKYVKAVESGVVHYGDTTLTFLSNFADADSKGRGMAYISAATIEEKSVYDYNQGNPTGDPKLFGKGKKPSTPLVAVYPKEGTLLSDNPFVILTTVTGDKKAAAEDFLDFVREGAQQKRFQQLAFRNYEGKPGSVVKESNGLLPDNKFTVIDPPSPDVLRQVVDGWSTLRKRARVLLVLDVSGSMRESVQGGGSKLDLAKRAVRSALTQFAPDDEVGLWTFSTGETEAEVPYTEQVPIGPVKANAANMQRIVAGLSPKGGTALYFTTRKAHEQMLAKLAPDRINAIVVLTDGRNEYQPDNNLAGLVKTLEASEEQSVRVFPIAYGEKADLEALKKIATAAQAKAYDASDPTSIDSVLTAVISNF